MQREIPKGSPGSNSITFLLSSNRRGKVYSLSLRAAHLRAAAVLALLLFGLTCVGLVDYFGLKLRPNDTLQLGVENESLRLKLEEVASKLSSLESNLDQLNSLTRKIEIITNRQERQPVFLLSDQRPSDEVKEFKEAGNRGGPLIEDLPLITHHDNAGWSTPARYPAFQIPSPSANPRLLERIIAAVRKTQAMEQKVLGLIETLAEQRHILAATPSIRPAFGWYTSRFGYRLDPFIGRPAMHAGVDFASAPGSPVWATADGVVRFAGTQSGYGNVVIIDHGYGVETRYAHNSRLLVHVGDKVKRRQRIAAVGSTGRSTGPHVHYEVRVHGQPVDPMNYLLDVP